MRAFYAHYFHCFRENVALFISLFMETTILITIIIILITRRPTGLERRLSQVLQGGSNMTGTDLCVNKPHCAAAVRP